MNIKKLFAAALSAMVLAGAFSISALAAEPTTSNIADTVSVSETSVSPRAENTGWRYKFENGKKYKRLYNYNTKKWVGDWIEC